MEGVTAMALTFAKRISTQSKPHLRLGEKPGGQTLELHGHGSFNMGFQPTLISSVVRIHILKVD
jgi:hypothetical protein